MNILMITRKVDRDDALAGFTCRWIEKLAGEVGLLKVICLERGNLAGLPDNVEIFSLGKERGKNRLKELINFQRGALRFVPRVDGVFCHMNPVYTILIAPYAKLFRKKIVTWYAHKVVNWQVRLIDRLADRILTPSPNSYNLKSRKKMVVGHGIDTDAFKPGREARHRKGFHIISVGRISPIKDYETLIEAAGILKDKEVRVDIAGSPGLPAHHAYFNRLKDLVAQKDLSEIVHFLGDVPHQKLPAYYQSADASVNLCPTGGADKAVLESMACGLPVLVCNRTFTDDLGPYTDQLLFRQNDASDLAQKISGLMCSEQIEQTGAFLRKQAVQRHDLTRLMKKIIYVFEELSQR